jgi:hypothetical protein
MSEAEWVTPEETKDAERISRREVYRRMDPGHPHRLIWKEREDGQQGRLIYRSSVLYHKCLY